MVDGQPEFFCISYFISNLLAQLGCLDPHPQWFETGLGNFSHSTLHAQAALSLLDLHHGVSSRKIKKIVFHKSKSDLVCKNEPRFCKLSKQR